jgi:hypothetical protein
LLFLLESPLEKILGEEQLGIRGRILNESPQEGFGLVAAPGIHEKPNGPLRRRVLIGTLVSIERLFGKPVAFKESAKSKEGAVAEHLALGFFDHGPGRNPGIHHPWLPGSRLFELIEQLRVEETGSGGFPRSEAGLEFTSEGGGADAAKVSQGEGGEISTHAAEIKKEQVRDFLLAMLRQVT